MSSIHEYIPDPSEIYSIQLDPPLTDKAIIDELSTSLSSPRIKYALNISPSQTASITVQHNKSRLISIREKCNSLEREIQELEKVFTEKEEERTKKDEERTKKDEECAKKDEERAKQEEANLRGEVYSRVAQAINDDAISVWESKYPTLVQDLKSNKINFLPYTLTAEAILWCDENHVTLNPPIPALDLYSYLDHEKYLKAAKRNREHGCQDIIDEAWMTFDPVDLQIMLTAWAKRDPSRNKAVHAVPSVAFANQLFNDDPLYDDAAMDRVRTFIDLGVNLQGVRLFND